MRRSLTIAKANGFCESVPIPMAMAMAAGAGPRQIVLEREKQKDDQENGKRQNDIELVAVASSERKVGFLDMTSALGHACSYAVGGKLCQISHSFSTSATSNCQTSTRGDLSLFLFGCSDVLRLKAALKRRHTVRRRKMLQMAQSLILAIHPYREIRGIALLFRGHFGRRDLEVARPAVGTGKRFPRSPRWGFRRQRDEDRFPMGRKFRAPEVFLANTPF